MSNQIEHQSKERSRLISLINILQYQASNNKDFLDFALEEAIKLTESTIGYIYHYDEDKRQFILNSWSRDVMKECSIMKPETCYALDKTGIWGEAVRQRKEIIVNDYHAEHPLKKGYPKGHVRLQRFMSVPVFTDERLVAVVGVANKKNDYDQTDVLQLQLLMDSVFKVLERRRAEADLFSSSERNRAILQTTMDGFWLLDLQGNLLEVNDNYCRMSGYSKEQLLTMGVSDIDADMTADDIAERIRAIMVHGNARFESRHRRKDGSVFDVEVSVQYQPAEGGRLISFARDITERKQSEAAMVQLTSTLERRVSERTEELDGIIAKLKREIERRKKTEKRLRDSEDSYRRIIASDADYIYTVMIENGEAVKTRIGEGCLAVTGYSKEEFEVDPQLWTNIVASEDRSLILNRISSIAAGKSVPAIEHRILRKDGSQRWVRNTCVPKYDDKGMLSSYDGLIQDITDRKKAEAELLNNRDYLEELVAERTRELNEAKEEAEAAVQVKSEFLSNMSHEIRTPMNAIIGMTHLVLDTELTKEQREYLAVVGQSSKSLLKILDDILNLSKMESGKLVLEHIDFDLETVISESLAIISTAAAEKGLIISHSIKPETPRMLKGDPVRLKQVLINLLGNSVKFTDNGSIAVTARRMNLAESENRSSARVLFSVHDTGRGIPYEKQEEIFRAFSQADGSITRKYGGTGLGLTISKMLVELMKGTIWVDSEPHVETTFYFIVSFEMADVSYDTGTSKNYENDSTVSEENSQLSILLVEDNEFNQMLAVRMLEKDGHVVTVAGNGKQAIEHLEKERFDLVLMDIHMPEIDGLQATRMIRDASSGVLDHDVPVIAMTADALIGDREKCIEAGMNNYISKPFDIKELRRIILKIKSTMNVK